MSYYETTNILFKMARELVFTHLSIQLTMTRLDLSSIGQTSLREKSSSGMDVSCIPCLFSYILTWFPRLLLGIFLLDVYFIILNGFSHQVVFPKLTMQLALHEACFQAKSADEYYGNLHLLSESKSLLWNTSVFTCFPPGKPL